MKTVIEMAEACGIPEFSNNESQVENIMAFAELVRADEREQCAKLVEGLFDDPNDFVLEFIVDAIRARGQA